MPSCLKSPLFYSCCLLCATLLTIVLYYFYFVRPLQAEVDKLENLLTEKNLLVENLQFFNKKYPQLDVALAQAAASHALWAKKLPPAHQTDEFIESAHTSLL